MKIKLENYPLQLGIHKGKHSCQKGINKIIQHKNIIGSIFNKYIISMIIFDIIEKLTLYSTFVREDQTVNRTLKKELFKTGINSK